MVYCRSDEAYLCLSCDRNVHSANALSKRHSRTLVCNRCNAQPASVRCVQEKLSLCQNCDWEGHNGSNSASGSHIRQTVNCYSSCPSAAELSSIWSFMCDPPSVIDSTCEQEMGLMSIADNKNGQGLSVPIENNSLQNVIQQSDPKDSSTFKISGAKGGEQFIDDGFYDDFNMDEADLSIEKYEVLFGVGNNDPENLFAQDGIDSLFGTKDTSVAESACQGGYVVKESLTGHGNGVQPACSNAASGDSVRSCKTEPNLCYWNISFSSLTGESNGGDYQDCGATSMPLMGEPPWHTPAHDSTTPSGIRNDAVLRYKEKKKTRKFEKRVRYATRKARADIKCSAFCWFLAIHCIVEEKRVVHRFKIRPNQGPGFREKGDRELDR
ncbi:hypothetical protein L1987_02223 [Smallanthus sonchifolius]|uniref:Uncharacterized protein n=1 Tax=Smallanthus sonchifolius TaxID=185202 RepID=A0ACB9K780_9ASTR|nr:hypothetical protein L1987_02223 [Smallanthus sonchifolius]